MIILFQIMPPLLCQRRFLRTFSVSLSSALQREVHPSHNGKLVTRSRIQCPSGVEHFIIFEEKFRMISHHVLFWLKADITPDQKAAFRKSLETLQNIEVVKFFHVGVPAPIERAVVDNTYTFSLLLTFDDLAAHDVYQVHPLHKAFLDEFRVFFEKVTIYDAN